MHVVGTQVSARIMMTPVLWGIEYVGRQQQPGRTNLPATPQRAAGNGSEQLGGGGPGFTLLPDQPVTYWNQTTEYSSHSSESTKERLFSTTIYPSESLKNISFMII